MSTKKAREAATTFNGREGRELEAARRSTQQGEIHAPPRRQADGSDPHTEENLDHGLEETFPASDPVSIHPGSD
jgi:hypothetical protein